MPSAAAKAAFSAMQEDDTNPLSGASVDLLLATASDVVEKLVSDAIMFDTKRDRIFPHLDDSEFDLGRVLGRGGFCVVKEIKKITLSPSGKAAELDNDVEFNKDPLFTRRNLQENCLREGEARYAIKILSKDCCANPSLFLKGTIDMAVETRFLAVLEHPHIVKMRAVSSVGQFEEGYFIVLDRLFDTLEQRLQHWNKKVKRTRSVVGKLSGGKKNRIKLTMNRIGVAHDLSSALQYMHKNQIIYRDIKPENCGFDVRDEIKIFDMGLAKELHEKDMNSDGTFKLTSFTGSLRYMAPEVAKGLPYNLSADVYSFGILFWQIIALEPPFVTLSCKLHDDIVVKRGGRPVCDKKWPLSWTSLMKKCWSVDPKVRPAFDEVTQVLRDETLIIDPDYQEDSLLDISRRSLEKAKI